MAQARLAEVIASLSLAIDTGMGQPLDFGLSVARLAAGTGRELPLDETTLADAYYLALVKHIGCTSDALEFAGLNGGDDNALRARALLWPAAEPAEVVHDMVRHLGAGRPALQRARLIGGMLAAGKDLPRSINAAHCETGGRLTERLGLSSGVRAGLAHAQERWDGKGLPDGVSGTALSPAHRVVMVAHDAVGLQLLGAPVRQVIQRRAGRAYDPEAVAAFGPAWERYLREEGDPWDLALAAEPGLPLRLTEDDLDRLCLAIADFVDLKSPHFLGHSTRVAELVDAASGLLGWPPDQRTAVRRAALLHDVGRASVPNGVWDKRGPLSTSDWERVRLHAYYGERVLARSPALAPLALLVGSHHEELDGTGYHRGVSGNRLGPAERLLRVADCYDAMVSERPYRTSLSAGDAAAELQRAVRAGRLDAEATAAVLGATRGPRRRFRPQRPSGLTEREVEVLRLLTRGSTNRQIAASLVMSPKTVGHHVEHIYAKAGVSTRAAAALFAVEVGVV